MLGSRYKCRGVGYNFLYRKEAKIQVWIEAHTSPAQLYSPTVTSFFPEALNGFRRKMVKRVPISLWTQKTYSLFFKHTSATRQNPSPLFILLQFEIWNLNLSNIPPYSLISFFPIIQIQTHPIYHYLFLHLSLRIQSLILSFSSSLIFYFIVFSFSNQKSISPLISTESNHKPNATLN